MSCPDKCKTCKLGKRVNRCQIKNVVYEIVCLHCDRVYIGETNRTMGTRIKEYLSMKKQTIFKPFASDNNNNTKNNEQIISWSILHSNITDDKERKCIEAFEIQKRSGQ